MKMKLREDAKWSMVIPTSMGIRICPEDGQPVQASSVFRMQVTSAESNVGAISSFLGEPVKILTNFVKGSPISMMIKSNLASRFMAYEGPDVAQGNAWGYRHQFNIADSGYGNRGARVWNDRAGEVGLLLDAKDFDLDRIFGEEGAKIVHMSGLIAALSPNTLQFCLDIAHKAKEYCKLLGKLGKANKASTTFSTRNLHCGVSTACKPQVCSSTSKFCANIGQACCHRFSF